MDEEDLLRRIYGSVEVPIFIVALNSDDDFRYLSVNRAYERLAGVRNEDVCGRPLEELAGLLGLDAAAERAQYRRCADTNDTISYEERRVLPGKEVWWLTRLAPLRDDSGRIVRITGSCVDITEWKRAKQEHQADLRVFEGVDRVFEAMRGTNDLEQMFRDVLDVTLSVFDCDRAWLVYPCDPETPTWGVPMERTKPEFPGAFAANLEFRTSHELVRVFRALVGTDGPVKFGPGTEHPMPADVAAAFGPKSQIATAIYPKVGKPYAFGLHQCTYARVWTDQEARLLQLIGERLADSLTSLLMYQELQASEQRYRLLAENAHDMIGRYLPDSTFLYVSPACRSLFGHDPEKLIGTKAFDLIHPDDVDRVRETVQRVVASGVGDTIEYRHRTEDGRYVWVETSGRVMRDPNTGQIIDLVCIVRDISERRRTQEELERLNRALHTLTDCNQSLIRATEEHELLATICRILVVTGGYEAAWVGYAGDADGQTVHVAAETENEAGLIESLRTAWANSGQGCGPAGAAIRTGNACSICAREHDAAHRTIREGSASEDCLLSVSLPLIAGGEILGSLNIHARRADMCGATEMALLDELAGDLAYGITALRTRRAREQAEADLLLFRQLTNQSNDAIFVADPESGQFIDVNDTACRGLGYARDELLSLTVFDIDAVFKDVSQWAVHRNVVQAAGAQTLESVHRRKDGTEFPVEASVSYVTREQRGYIVAVIRDITERKQAEDTLKMNEERFRLIAMNSPDIITAQDGALRYTWVVNPIPPHTQDDFIGKTDWDLRPPEEARKLSEVKQSVLDSGESHREEISLCVLGEVHWFDSFFQPVRNEAGEVVGVRHYARDITERKQSEDEIRRQLSELQRWHDVTLGREDRVQEMKREVNELCKRLGEAPRYPSQDAPSTSATVHGRKSANSHGERDTAGRDEIPGMGPELDLSAKRQS